MSKTQYRQEDVEYVEAEVVTPAPIQAPEPESVFTSEDFEDALDKVSRTVKGKYVDKLPSSEEFIKDKRTEVELEERSL
jgi:hypothetical protein